MSCIELLKHWGIPVSEERLPIADVMKASHDGKLEEVFGTGYRCSYLSGWRAALRGRCCSHQQR